MTIREGEEDNSSDLKKQKVEADIEERSRIEAPDVQGNEDAGDEELSDEVIKELEASGIRVTRKKKGAETQKEEKKEELVVSDEGALVTKLGDVLHKNGIAEPSGETELREEKLNYLATQMVRDLEIYYGQKPDGKKEADKRLSENGIQPVLQTEGKVGVKDWKRGKNYARELADFFARVRDWKDFPEQSKVMLEALGLNLEELREARLIEKRRIVGEAKNEGKLVWYPQILDDLKIITFLDEELSDSEQGERQKSFNKLIRKGILLPEISTYDKQSEWFANRQRLRAAVEFLRDANKTKVDGFWQSRAEAIDYLNSIGIGDRTGSEYLRGSVEERLTSAPKKERRGEEKPEQVHRDQSPERSREEISWSETQNKLIELMGEEKARILFEKMATLEAKQAENNKKRLTAAVTLLGNMEMRKANQKFWEDNAKPILEGLGIKVV